MAIKKILDKARLVNKTYQNRVLSNRRISANLTADIKRHDEMKKKIKIKNKIANTSNGDVCRKIKGRPWILRHTSVSDQLTGL